MQDYKIIYHPEKYGHVNIELITPRSKVFFNYNELDLLSFIKEAPIGMVMELLGYNEKRLKDYLFAVRIEKQNRLREMLSQTWYRKETGQIIHLDVSFFTDFGYKKTRHQMLALIPKLDEQKLDKLIAFFSSDEIDFELETLDFNNP